MPVYNEVNTVLKIIERVQSVPVEKELIIVCDNSTDGTRELLQKYQAENKFKNTKIFYFDQNRGKGAAVAYGYGFVSGEFVIVQDADLEYDPQDYLKLLAAAEKNKAAAVYGSRFLGQHENFSSAHYWGNKILTRIFNLLYGTKLTDLETCYKLLRRANIENIEIKAARFNFDPEITAKIVKQKIPIVEVPINYQARSFTAGKKISWRDGFSAVWTIIKYRVLN